jgi:hypothetical protein
MGLSLLEMRTIMRRTLGVDESDDGFSDIDCNTKLNRSYWELVDRLNFRENELTIPFGTIAGSRKYNMPVDNNALRSIAIFDENNQSHKLDRMTKDVYDQKYNNKSDGSFQAIPTDYYREGTFIQLWPTPDKIYICELHYWKNLNDLALDTDVLPLPESWHEIVLLGGVWRGYIELGDMTRYTSAKNSQLSLIADAVPTEAKEEIDSRMAHVEVPGREYP